MTDCVPASLPQWQDLLDLLHACNSYDLDRAEEHLTEITQNSDCRSVVIFVRVGINVAVRLLAS